ncbi:MAG: ethanolamine utilization microcompartment protein EutL [Eubacteriales bacterium]|nr:ethanolamine utilization microcompartment protein EutL [Eubacteriales bacterium]
MNSVRIQPHVLSQKVIANVNPELARIYKIPEDHQSIGFFSCDNDDVAYLAADDATKKANIKVIHAETFYGGQLCSWSKYGGSVFVLISGPKVTDVKSGLAYINDFVANRSALYNFDGDDGTAYYAQCIPKVGKYYQELYNIPEGMAYTYLVGGPIETNYALDKALKSSDTKIANYWYPPSHANSSGAILYGTESACQAATRAFVDALASAIKNPMNI